MPENQQDQTDTAAQSNQHNDDQRQEHTGGQPENQDQPAQGSAETLKDKKHYVERVIQVLEESEAHAIKPTDDALEPVPIDDPPWTLQQFFNGEIDLESELSTRFSSMPVMSSIRFRGLGTRSTRGVAALATQDGAAQVTFDADKSSRVVQVSFTFGSMLTLRFVLRDLVDRQRWLELMRRSEGGLAFLWGTARWENDYVICVSRRYYTNFYAFSPNGFEAAARFTPAVTKQLIDWLETYWSEDDQHDDTSPLLTW